MTVALSGVPKSYEGTGLDTALSTVFLIFAAADVVVTKRITATGVDTVLTEGVHYNTTGHSADGAVGTVTPIDGETDFPDTVTWTLSRSVALTQSLDYVENDNFPAVSHERGLDRLQLQVQDADQKAGRAISIPVADDSDTNAPLTVIVPDATTRASKFLGFDADGNTVVTTNAGDTGAQGPEGPEGPQGPAGEDSDIAGPAGADGEDGAAGADGEDGAAGADGDNADSWVLLDTATELTGAEHMFLNATDWPATYNVVRIEFLGVWPTVADKGMRIKVLNDSTTATSIAGMKYVGMTYHIGIPGGEGFKAVAGNTWQTDTVERIANGEASGLQGLHGTVRLSVTDTATTGGFLVGTATWTYRDDVDTELVHQVLGLSISGEGGGGIPLVTSHDGFKIDSTSGNTTNKIAGRIQLWGLPI